MTLAAPSKGGRWAGSLREAFQNLEYVTKPRFYIKMDRSEEEVPSQASDKEDVVNTINESKWVTGKLAFSPRACEICLQEMKQDIGQ